MMDCRALTNVARNSSVSQSLNPWWEVLHITEAGLMESGIDTVPKEKALHATAEDSAPGSNCYQKWPSQRGQLCGNGLVAIKVKTKISMALCHVSMAESAWATWSAPPRELARSLPGPRNPARRVGRTSTRADTCQHWLPVPGGGL